MSDPMLGVLMGAGLLLPVGVAVMARFMVKRRPDIDERLFLISVLLFSVSGAFAVAIGQEAEIRFHDVHGLLRAGGILTYLPSLFWLIHIFGHNLPNNHYPD